LKVAAIAVGSKEWLADSSPAAEMLIRDALVQASSQKVDGTFFSTTAASAGVSPAGILNGVAGFNSYGPTQAGAIGDLKRLVGVFQTARNSSGLVIVTTPALATGLGLMLTALGQPAFPGLTQEGGTLHGYRVLTGDNVPSGAVILMKPSDVYRIGDMGITVSVSDVATLEQDTAPQGASDTPTAASATIMSMFGTESVAFKVVRRVNFAKRRTSAVAYVDNADYGATDTST
jgi:HK97 family phage major capsid protein